MNNTESTKIVALEDRIFRVSRSTKTTIPFLSPLHNWMRAHFGWYYAWHLNQFSSTVHKFFFFVILLVIGSVIVIALGGGFIFTILLLSLK